MRFSKRTIRIISILFVLLFLVVTIAGAFAGMV